MVWEDISVNRFTTKPKYLPICATISWFGISVTNARKKVRRGKIYVQPEAVKRRKHTNGSRNSNVKRMRVKNNPFDKEVSTKRKHEFSSNVRENVAVSKKAGRTMTSKTKHLTTKGRLPLKENLSNKEIILLLLCFSIYSLFVCDLVERGIRSSLGYLSQLAIFPVQHVYF